MTSRSQAITWPALKLKLGGAAFALSLGLVACGNSNTTTTTATDGTYALTVTLTGITGNYAIVLTDASGNAQTYTLASGAIITGLKGIYTVSGPAVSGHTTPAAQKVDLSTANQTVTLAY